MRSGNGRGPRVLLICPKFPESFWTMTATLAVLKRRYSVAPNGLATVAALTPSSWQVSIIDENVEALDFDADVDIVGITAYTTQLRRLEEIAREFKRRGKLVVLGGPACTSHLAEGAQTIEGGLDAFCDVLFVGEAEHTWPRFCRDYTKGTWSSRYEEHEKVDVSESPMPRFELLKLERYAQVAVQTTRGCPFHCEFCDVIKLFGRIPRYKTPAQVAAEVERVLALGGRHVLLADDNFIGNRRHATETLRALIDLQERTGRRLRFATQLTIDGSTNPKLLDLMHEAGFGFVFIGIESPSTRSLTGAAKKVNVRRDLTADLRQFIQRGIQVMAGMIVGFDQDAPSVFDDHLAFIRASALPIVMEGVLFASLGTPLFERLDREGRLLIGKDDLDGDNFTTRVSFRPYQMNGHQLLMGHRRLVNEIYSQNEFVHRLARMIRRMKTPPKVGHYSATEVVEAIRVFWHLYRNAETRWLARQGLGMLWKYPRFAYPICYNLALYIHMRKFSNDLLAMPLEPDVPSVLSLGSPAIKASDEQAQGQLIPQGSIIRMRGSTSLSKAGT